jgi:hypothetical protein
VHYLAGPPWKIRSKTFLRIHFHRPQHPVSTLAHRHRLPAEVALYLDSKRGEDLAANTLYKHKLTLSRLETFCDAEGL